jgi:hypothetical protein
MHFSRGSVFETYSGAGKIGRHVYSPNARSWNAAFQRKENHEHCVCLTGEIVSEERTVSN